MTLKFELTFDDLPDLMRSPWWQKILIDIIASDCCVSFEAVKDE